MPTLSVVIPVHNKWELTAACLRSLAEHTPGGDVAVIVVDNASADDTSGACPALGSSLFGRRFRYRRFENNRNFGPACNAGAALADSDLLFFLITTPCLRRAGCRRCRTPWRRSPTWSGWDRCWRIRMIRCNIWGSSLPRRAAASATCTRVFPSLTRWPAVVAVFPPSPERRLWFPARFFWRRGLLRSIRQRFRGCGFLPGLGGKRRRHERDPRKPGDSFRKPDPATT